MFIREDVKYIGVNDREIDLFEGQYDVPEGMAYNSYVILDDKVAVMDTVDANFTEQWLEQLAQALDGRQPDYLIVHHMEPDHSASIMDFADAYPHAQIVATAKAFVMMKQFFGTDFAQRRMVVGEKDTLSLGNHELTFITAPMVHWPEVMMTYDSRDKILFSADAFGKFGDLDAEDDWDFEARRYYFGIVGKYGAQVQTLLKKATTLEIQTICPLHGPVLQEDLEHYLKLYHIWSNYEVEAEGVLIAYASIYGNTGDAAMELADLLHENGCPDLVVTDLARCDMSEAVADAFCYGKLVLASSTYNGDVFPPMRVFIQNLLERGYQNRTIALMENGSWAPTAAKVMKTMLEKGKNLTFADTTVKILSALNDESRAQVEALAKELC